MSLSTTLLLILAIITEIAREIFFKLAADKPYTGGYFMHLLKTPLMWGGLILWAVEIIAWIMVLARAPLSIAFPLMSLCYVGTLICSWWFLDEQISRQKWAGVALITIGVAIVGSTGI